VKIGQILRGALVGGVAMLILGVAVQLLPWGFDAVEPLPVGAALAELPDTPLPGAMYLLAGDAAEGRTAAFIALSDPGWHSIPRKLGYDLAMQVALAAVFSVILLLTVSLRNRDRVAIIFGMALATSIGAFLPEWNWWGFSLLYVVGASVNLLLVWTAVGYVLARWVLKSVHPGERGGIAESRSLAPGEPATVRSR
jgi:hypothetical protein